MGIAVEGMVWEWGHCLRGWLRMGTQLGGTVWLIANTTVIFCIHATVVCGSQPSREGSQAVVTKLNVAAGLGELMCSKYKASARLFLSANIDHCDFPEVMCLLPCRCCFPGCNGRFCRLWNCKLSPHHFLTKPHKQQQTQRSFRPSGL